jgi:ribosomal protein S16
MEVLGTYDPTPRVPLATVDEDPIISTPSQSGAIADATALPSETSPAAKKPKRYKDIQLDMSRTKYWLGVGAQPSEPVWRLLALVSTSIRRVERGWVS